MCIAASYLEQFLGCQQSECRDSKAPDKDKRTTRDAEESVNVYKALCIERRISRLVGDSGKVDVARNLNFPVFVELEGE